MSQDARQTFSDDFRFVKARVNDCGFGSGKIESRDLNADDL